MQKTWLPCPSPGKSAIALALSLSLLTGCFEEENKTQSKNQESTASQVVETISDIDVPTAPENPLEQSDWTTDFLKPGEIIPPIVKPEIALPEAGLPIDEGDMEDEECPTPWYHPIRGYTGGPTGEYMLWDKESYPLYGRHIGCDYAIPGHLELQYCADGEVVDRGEWSEWEQYIASGKDPDRWKDLAEHPLTRTMGNYFFLYVECIDKTFLYAHLQGSPPQLGKVEASQACGIAGETGTSARGVHLHLECWDKERTAASRDISSLAQIIKLTADPACVLNHYISGQEGEPDCSCEYIRKDEVECPCHTINRELDCNGPFRFVAESTDSSNLGTSRTVGTSSLLDALQSENP